MENNQPKKNWNKESLYSISALFLAFLSYFGLATFFDKADYSNSLFDTFMLNISNGKWAYASLDLRYWMPIILGLVFLTLALSNGIQSIKKTSHAVQKGRMLGIVSATLTTFIIAVIVLLTIFPL